MSCITLLSDFGLYDASVAVAKGVLMQHAPGAVLADISHEVMPYHMGQAAYLLGCAWPHFPAGTVHVVLFDIFSEPVPRLVLSEYKGHYFLSADNGVLPAALGTMPEQSRLCLELTREDSFVDWLHAAGGAVKELMGQKGNGVMGSPCVLKAGVRSVPVAEGDVVHCEVVHIDQYENVVTNMTRQEFEALRGGRRFRVQFLAEEITELSNHYQDVREGFKLCRFNSAGHLELCINRGHAASLFGLRLGSKHNDVRIFFE